MTALLKYQSQKSQKLRALFHFCQTRIRRKLTKMKKFRPLNWRKLTRKMNPRNLKRLRLRITATHTNY